MSMDSGMKKFFRVNDGLLFFLAVVNSLLGVLMVFDTQVDKAFRQTGSLFPRAAVQHLGFFALGVLGFFLIGRIKLDGIRRAAPIVWFFALLFLVLVETPLGQSGGNATRWLGFGPEWARFQPSEFAKLALLLYVSAIIVKRKPFPEGKRFKSIPAMRRFYFQRWKPVMLIMGAVVLTTFQPDLGSAAVIYVVAFALFWAGGVQKKSLYGTIGGTLILGTLAVFAERYRLERILIHWQRWDDRYRMNFGYQTTQSEIAHALGGIFGRMPGGGVMKATLPAAHTDFIFATVGEELGLIGALLFMALQFAIPLRLITLSNKAPTPFGRFVVLGTSVWLTTHIAVNIMMTNGALPAIGIPLPFVSYGGSSMLALWAAMGLCNLSIQKQQPQNSEDPSEGDVHGWRHGRPHLSGA